MAGIVVSFLSFWIDIWRNSIKNKNKKKFIIKGAFSEIIDAKNYLGHSLELIKYIKEEDIGEDKIINFLKDIRKQIDSIDFTKIQHLHENIYLTLDEFAFSKLIYQIKDIKSNLQMHANLAIERKRNEADFFQLIEDCYNRITDLIKSARKCNVHLYQN